MNGKANCICMIEPESHKEYLNRNYGLFYAYSVTLYRIQTDWHSDSVAVGQVALLFMCVAIFVPMTSTPTTPMTTHVVAVVIA